MVKPYSMDLRDRIVGAVLTPARSVATRFGVSESGAIKWVRRHRETGSPAPSQIGGHKPRLLNGALRDWLIARGARDFTLRGLAAGFSAEYGVKVDYVQVWRLVHDEGLSFKKGVLPAEQLRPKIAPHRERWQKYLKQVDPARLVFVDETWAKANMATLRGCWAPVGQRLHAKVPYDHWKAMTFVAALRCDRIDAPFVFDQPINAASFTAWVEPQLCPTLKRSAIVVLDNLSSHKKPAIRAAIRAKGARLPFLPPYSLDLNPMEQVFAKLKHLLRTAAERTKEATWRRIGSLLDAFTPQVLRKENSQNFRCLARCRFPVTRIAVGAGQDPHYEDDRCNQRVPACRAQPKRGAQQSRQLYWQYRPGHASTADSPRHRWPNNAGFVQKLNLGDLGDLSK